MGTGRKASVYLSEQTNKFCNDLIKESHCSLSDTVASAVREQAMQNFVHVRLSEGAYLCLAANRPDLLHIFTFENGITMVCAKEEAFRLKGETRGPLTDEKAKLMRYLTDVDAVR